MKWNFTVRGMHCAGCAARLEKALNQVDGVRAASVQFALASGWVETVETVSWAAIQKRIQEAGFESELGASESALSGDGSPRPDAALAARCAWAWFGFLPLAAISMSEHFLGRVLLGEHSPWRFWIEAACSAGVVFGAGRQLLSSAFTSIWRRMPDMDFLVGGGALAAWAGSGLAAAFPPAPAAVHGMPEHSSFYEAASGIVAFALLGRWLEARTRARAGGALEALAQLQPRTARICGPSGESPSEVSLEQVLPGMQVMVPPGERVPVDGVILSGTSAVDESWISGEPVPVRRRKGDRIFSGSVNGTGALVVRVETSGKDASIRQILTLVREAQALKPAIQRVADRISGGFCLAILVAACLTAMGWLVQGAWQETWSTAFWRGLSVLVVACPCALGLATPVAVIAGTGTAALRGILFRSGTALETLSSVRAVIFDKTGTLTEGRLRVTEWWEQSGYDPDVLRWVAAAESQSAHPISAAVLQAARERGLSIPSPAWVQSTAEGGLCARVEDHEIQVGTSESLTKAGVELPGTSDGEPEPRVWIAVNRVFAGWFRTADPLREEAAREVATLRRMGIRVLMLSGDAEDRALRVAREIGISEVLAGVRPEGKRDAIARLQRGGCRVAMVGDGINDAPALAQADVGMALASGTAVAQQTASVLLLRSSLGTVSESICIARQTMRVIRQNLVFAFGYNVLAVPFAAGVFLPWIPWSPGPAAASAAMALSSLSVVLNALRLRTRAGAAAH